MLSTIYMVFAHFQIAVVRFNVYVQKRKFENNSCSLKVVALTSSFLNLFKLCSKVLPLWWYEVNNVSHKWLFSTFLHFPHENNTKQDDFSTVRRVREGLQSLYCGKFDPKREVHTLKGTMTLTDYKGLFIYTHLYLQALIQVPSVTMQWNPVEWMHSCRNLWGIKKYSSGSTNLPDCQNLFIPHFFEVIPFRTHVIKYLSNNQEDHANLLILTVLYPPPWLPVDSDWNVGIPSGICWNGQNLSFCQTPMESKWNSIPTDSNPFQPIPTHSMGHSNTFQHIPSSFHQIPRAIPTHSR